MSSHHILSHVLIWFQPSHFHWHLRFSHWKVAYLFNLMATILTFVLFWISLKLKICSTICNQFIKLSNYRFLSKMRIFSLILRSFNSLTHSLVTLSMCIKWKIWQDFSISLQSPKRLFSSTLVSKLKLFLYHYIS